MDRVHQSDEKAWISKRKVNLKQLAEERAQQLANHNILLNRQELSAQLSKSTHHEQLKHLVQKFVAKHEADVRPYFLFNSTDEKALVREPQCQLKTYQLQLEHAQRMISDRNYKVNYLASLRTTRKELLMRHLALINRPTSPLPINYDQEATTDNAITPSTSRALAIRRADLVAIVVVQIWPQPTKTTKIRLVREIFFRADQCLTELRDQFKCQRDYGVPLDLSDNPQEGERIFRGELFKSGFFLIEDTFYNDLRDQNNTDLSTPICEWAAKEVTTVGPDGKNIKVSHGIGPFQRAKMEETRFEDIEAFRLGCPYLYMHQGDCEHLFTFSDIRYVPNDQTIQQTKFPFVTATSIGGKSDWLRCYMCNTRPPHWYTRGNNRLPVDPYFFCENCFYSFNYKPDKRTKIGQFQAFLYTSTIGIPDSVVIL